MKPIERNCFFMRRTTLSEDEFDEEAAPLFIKIPIDFMMPSVNQIALLTMLGEYYGADGYMLVDSLEENKFTGDVRLVPFGISANITLLITSTFSDGVEMIVGLITQCGEFALGFFDGNDMVIPVLDKEISRILELETSEKVQEAHNDFLRSIDCEDCKEQIYIPNVLYQT
ncbi:MAG: hypothetical protein Q4A25_03190 [Candidatus Saccharibacteria bacterium]|nr:hypothetical protein [Candidatus Saccharibacteria bacterium]